LWAPLPPVTRCFPTTWRMFPPPPLRLPPKGRHRRHLIVTLPPSNFLQDRLHPNQCNAFFNFACPSLFFSLSVKPPVLYSFAILRIVPEAVFPFPIVFPICCFERQLSTKHHYRSMGKLRALSCPPPLSFRSSSCRVSGPLWSAKSFHIPNVATDAPPNANCPPGLRTLFERGGPWGPCFFFLGFVV